MRKRLFPSQPPANSDDAKTTTSASQLLADSNDPNTAVMAPKRRVVGLDGDDDSDVVEIYPTPSAGMRPSKAPRTMVPTPRSTPSADTPGPAPGVATPQLQQQFFKLGVGTTISSGFFPDRTLMIIAELRRLEIHTVMQAYESNTRIATQHKFTIMSETTIDSTKELSTYTAGPSSPSLSFVNAQLLRLFLARNPRLKAMKERPRFMMLAPIKDIKNPRFAHLHAVRYDEVGCGFDEDNCLSLFLSELVEGERHTNVLYVERTEVEVEDKAEDVPRPAEVQDEGRK